MILGVDLGQKTTGLSISHGQLATPFATIKHQNTQEAVEKIVQICDQENVKTVVVGYVEGKIKSLFENFAKRLKKARPNLQIAMWDETLTTRQATETMIKLGIPKIKRQKRQHEIAASLILQSYLDAK